MSLKSAFKTVSCVSEVIEDTNPNVWLVSANNKLEGNDLKGALYDIDRSIYYYGNNVNNECWSIRSNIVYKMAKDFYTRGLYYDCINLLDKEFFNGKYANYKQKIYTLKFDSYYKIKEYRKAISIFLSTKYCSDCMYIFFIIAIIIPCVYIGNVKNNIDKSHGDISVENKTELSLSEIFSVDTIKNIEQKLGILNDNNFNGKYYELSLNGIWLGTTKMDIEKSLGKPSSTNFDGKYDHSFYDDIEVLYYGNKVVTLILDGNRFKTEKGISVGMSKNDIISKYGESSMAYIFDDLHLYEYEVESKDGRKGLLRFAVKVNNDKIHYISVRIPDEWINGKE